MKRNFGKIGIICLALVIALGSLGVGLASWSEELVINAEVKTGNFDCHLADISCRDNEGGLDVGSCTCDKTGDESFTVDIDNGYEGYECRASFDVTNGGTIPGKIDTIDIDNPHGDIGVTLSGISVGDFIPVGGSVSGELEIVVGSDNVGGSFEVTIDTTRWNAP